MSFEITECLLTGKHVLILEIDLIDLLGRVPKKPIKPKIIDLEKIKDPGGLHEFVSFYAEHAGNTGVIIESIEDIRKQTLSSISRLQSDLVEPPKDPFLESH